MKVGVLGGSSPIGTQLIKLLTEQGDEVLAFSRGEGRKSSEAVQWFTLAEIETGPSLSPSLLNPVDLWVSVAPIWVLRQHFPWLLKSGVKKIIALSSTSRYTKSLSSNAHEAKVVNDLISGEEVLQAWAEQNNIQWVVLRPTLIYGRSTDRNLSEIARIIRKFRFFPLIGSGIGLRQPVYVDDVARACLQAAKSKAAVNKAYNISGADIITYREMIQRIFVALGLTPRLVPINVGLFKVVIAMLRVLPRYRHWGFNMADRMNKDMIFEYAEAHRDFGFTPQAFALTDEDVR